MRSAEGHATERDRVLAAIADALHDLCQPLTALACRLEIGQIGQMEEQAPGPKISPGAWAECLTECERMNRIVTAMRKLVQQAQAMQ